MMVALLVAWMAVPRIGDPMPALEDSVVWLAGEPVPSFEPGRVHVIELWATWCPPCIPMIDHLSTIAAEQGDQVTVIGIAVGADVGIAPEEFVEAHRTRFRYTVGMEARPDLMRQRLVGTEDLAIPHLMIVDRRGRLAWRNDPAVPEAGIDEALSRIIAGEHDLQAAAREDRRREAARQRAEPDLARLEKLESEGKIEEMVPLLKEMAAADSREFGGRGVDAFVQMLCLGRELEAYRYGRSLVATTVADQPSELVRMERAILGLPGVQYRDYGLALAAIRRAKALRGEDDPDFMFELAKVRFAAGDAAEAERLKAGAVEAARENGWDSSYVEFIAGDSALEVSLYMDAARTEGLCYDRSDGSSPDDR